MTSSSTLRAANLSFSLKFLLSYGKSQLLGTLSKMLRKSTIFLIGLHWAISWVLWVKLTILCPFKFWLSYSLHVMVSKDVAHNEKFVHLQIDLCKY